MPNDVALFEQYWIDQFGTLLNVVGDRSGTTSSPIAQQVISALRAQIEQAKQQRG